MSSLRRASVALVLSSAFVLAVACGSNNSKKAAPPLDDAGAAGAKEPTAGSTSGGAPAAGAAGESASGAAGEGGSAGLSGGSAGAAEAGSAGDASAEGGAAGAPPSACVPSGAVQSVAVEPNPIQQPTSPYQVCLGGAALLPFTAQSTDATFSCCGTSSAGYAFQLLGISNFDGGGDLVYQVPTDAPYSTQDVTIACSQGQLDSTLSVEVTDTVPPSITTVDTQIVTQQGLSLDGLNLLDVDWVRATPVGATGDAAAVRSCGIDPETHTATHIDCSFGYIAPGTYVISAFQANCGSIEEHVLTVINAL